jgi:hypothetical protein
MAAARDVDLFRASRRSRRQKAQKNLPATWVRRSSTFCSESSATGKNQQKSRSGLPWHLTCDHYVGYHSQPLLASRYSIKYCIYILQNLCNCISLAIIQYNGEHSPSFTSTVTVRPHRDTAMSLLHIGSQMMEATLRGTCVELHDGGRAIRFRALEFTLHPDAVHL